MSEPDDDVVITKGDWVYRVVPGPGTGLLWLNLENEVTGEFHSRVLTAQQMEDLSFAMLAAARDGKTIDLKATLGFP